ncbi:shikimate dehydrogenase [Roseofilum casamattae]|uniref:Shikimate dehydrogenase (NADP(+)) n=1 Tax=Roseofilum casamattae BLCC-M143 TaxID=3022442 RepID=A0ABT7C000_9CYAN|nr:shikimate dehydrogenase [Roseofilum casamattae]MDJ1184387.1 shikimate dehydrogenase [Roseofilum casamattae BLCC-M143]
MQPIQGTTDLLGIIGHPVEHSLSPAMHNAALSDLGVDCAYIPFPVAPEHLEAALQGLHAVGTLGLNVTIPHKQAVIPYLSEITPVARAVGAVNTLWRSDRGWRGTNTDVAGFIAPLQRMARDWSDAKVAILGYGGAARAVVAGCLQLGVTQIHIVGRDRDRLQRFQHSWDAPLNIHLWQELSSLLAETTLLVNSTPVGMFPDTNCSPGSKEDLSKLPSGAIAYDLIYNPRPTQFLQLANALGFTTIDGSEMLVQQGAAALELWLGRSVPVSIMRQTLLNALQS